MFSNPSILVLVALVVPAVAWVLLKHPHLAILLVLLMFPLEQLLQSYVPALLVRPQLINYAIGFLALAAIIAHSLNGQRLLPATVNTGLVASIGVYVIAVFGLLWTPSRDTATDMMRGNWPFWVLMLGITPLLCNNITEWRRILIPMLVVGSGIALLILINPASSYYSGRLTLDLGMQGTDRRGNPLAIAQMGGMLAIVAALCKPARRGSMTSIIRASAFVLGLGLAVGSGSRGQVLGAIAAGVLFYPAARRIANPRQFFLTVIGLSLLIVGVMTVMRLFIGDQNEERWDLWRMIQDIVLRFDFVWLLLGEYLAKPESWLLGLGPNAFAAYDPTTPYVHNIVAEILCEEGLVGFTLLIVAFGFSYRRWRFVLRMNSENAEARAAIAVLGALVAFQLFLALKQGTILTYPTVFMWLAITCRVCMREQHEDVEVFADDEADTYEAHDPLYAYPRHA